MISSHIKKGKTVLIDLTSLYDHLTGIERYAAEIAHALICEYPDNSYILVFKNRINERFLEFAQWDNINMQILNGCNKLYFNQIRLTSFLYKNRADIYLFLAFPAPVTFWCSRIYTTIHDVAFLDCGDTMKPLSKWYFRIHALYASFFAKRIITISKFSGVRIIKRLKVNKRRLWLIYCGINGLSPDTGSLSAYNLPEKYILSLSTLEPRKNLGLLLRSYDRLIAERTDAPDLVLAGRMGWKMEDFLSEYSEHLREKVHITGFVKDEDLGALYQGAELFVFPSMYEGFGMPPLEAASAGAVVLCSDAASMPEVMGDAAVYFKSGDEDELTQKLKDVLNIGNDERDRLVKKGMERARLFSWNNEAHKLGERLYL